MTTLSLKHGKESLIGKSIVNFKNQNTDKNSNNKDCGHEVSCGNEASTEKSTTGYVLSSYKELDHILSIS